MWIPPSKGKEVKRSYFHLLANLLLLPPPLPPQDDPLIKGCVMYPVTGDIAVGLPMDDLPRNDELEARRKRNYLRVLEKVETLTQQMQRPSYVQKAPERVKQGDR